MRNLPDPVIRLTAALGRLPGIGPRSAERLALHLVQADVSDVEQLAEAMRTARSRIGACRVCGALTESQPCVICDSAERDATVVCVVEKPMDVISLERSGTFKGRYHVLGGRLSPLNGVGPEDLRIAALERRMEGEAIREVILALGSDVEGDATCHYLASRLEGRAVRVTRLAQGLPAGSGLEFADELTLSRALDGRREMGTQP